MFINVSCHQISNICQQHNILHANKKREYAIDIVNSKRNVSLRLCQGSQINDAGMNLRNLPRVNTMISQSRNTSRFLYWQTHSTKRAVVYFLHLTDNLKGEKSVLIVCETWSDISYKNDHDKYIYIYTGDL